MRVPLYDPRADYHALKEPIDEAIRSVLESGVYTVGPHVTAFEEELARFLDGPHVIGVSSGSAALELSLIACGIGEGDEVITAPNSDISTAAAITHCGARVVFADIDADTLTIDPLEIEKKITPRTRAMVPVHLFGQLADMDAIGRLSREHDLTVIEDAALAVGGEYRGVKAGRLGDVGCFSMNSRKILSGFGDAGAVVTENDAVARTVRSLKDYGKDPARHKDHVPGAIVFHHEGFNARLDELQAAVLRVKLRALPERLDRRRSIAVRYASGLSRLDLSLPAPEDHVRHAYRAYTVRLSDPSARDGLAAHLAQRGIDSGIYYAPPLHLQPAYRYLGHAKGDFPVTETVALSMLSLPIDPALSDDQVDFVITAIQDYLSRHAP